MKVTTVGLDLAKQVFSVHGVDEHGKAVLRKRVSRGKLLELFAQLPPALVGMEACSGAHHWGRELGRLRPSRRDHCESACNTDPLRGGFRVEI
jgi:transposase